METRWMNLRRKAPIIGLRVKFATKVPRPRLRHIDKLKQKRWAASTLCHTNKHDVSSCKNEDYLRQFVVFNCNLNAAEQPKQREERGTLLRKRKPPNRAQLVTRSITAELQRDTQKKAPLPTRKKASLKRKKGQSGICKIKEKSPSQNADQKATIPVSATGNNPVSDAKGTARQKSKKKKKKRLSNSTIIKGRQWSHGVRTRSSTPSGLDKVPHTNVSETLVSKSNQETTDWPNLIDVNRRKSLAKDIATELVRSKRSGSVTKMTQRRWADIVRPKSKESVIAPLLRGDNYSGTNEQSTSNNPSSEQKKTWANVAAASAINSSRISTPTSNEKRCAEYPSVEINTPSFRYSRRKRVIQKPNLSPTMYKCKGKPQSLAFYKRLTSETSKTKRKKKTIKYKRSLSNMLKSNVEQNTLVQRQTAETGQQANWATKRNVTSTQNNGHERWCIDNMPVVYTTSVSSVIQLNGPPKIERNLLPRKDQNKCNNRKLMREDIISPEIGNLPLKDELSDRVVQDLSEPDICSRLNCISFPSPKAKHDAKLDPTVALIKNTKHSIPHIVAKASVEEGEHKKVSLKYRALIRGSESRQKAKLVSERQTRNKRNGAMLGDKLTSKDRLKVQRQERQQRVPKERGSKTWLSPDRNPPFEEAYAQGTSKDFMNLWFDDQDEQTEEPLGICGKEAYADEKDVNNSFDFDTWTKTKTTTELPFTASDIDIDLIGSDENGASERLTDDIVLFDQIECLDVDWWCSFLFQDRSRVSARHNPH